MEVSNLCRRGHRSVSGISTEMKGNEDDEEAGKSDGRSTKLSQYP